MAAPGPALRLVGTHDRPANPQGIEDRVWQTQRMPTITNIAITGEHAESDGIELIGTLQPALRGIHIRRCRHGIRLAKHNRNVIISNCHIFHNHGNGIFVDQCNLHQINVTGNHISYNRTGGIRVEGSQVFNLQITGNDIEYNNHNSHGTTPEPRPKFISIRLDPIRSSMKSPFPQIRSRQRFPGAAPTFESSTTNKIQNVGYPDSMPLRAT